MHPVPGDPNVSTPSKRSVGALRSSRDSFDPLFGESPAIARVREWLRGLAALRAPVLLLGESGTGRHAAARRLHAIGPTPDAEFVAVDAASSGQEAIPLCGTVHIHGLERMTSEAQRRWRCLALSPPARTRLIGSAGPLFPDRIAREDLDTDFVQALRRFEVRLPALRERPGDIPGLAAGLLESVGSELGRPDRQLTGGALRRLARERWPGNLAELRRVVERLVAFSDRPRIGLAEVEAVLEDIRPSVAELRSRHQLEERETLIRNLEQTGGNVTDTAERMQRSRAAIYRLVEKHGIVLRRKS